MTNWQIRIVGNGTEDPASLLANPKNWREHSAYQQRVMADVLGGIGWVQDVIVNRATGHIVDGHMRVALAVKNNQDKVPVKYVDLSELEETAVLATLDPISALASTDGQLLAEVLAEVAIEGDALASFLQTLNPAKDEIATQSDTRVPMRGDERFTEDTSSVGVFAPTLDVTVSRKEVTENDVAEARQKMREMIWKAPAVMNAACPKCGAEFLVERP